MPAPVSVLDKHLSESWKKMNEWKKDRRIKETNHNSFTLSHKKLYLLHNQWLQYNAQHERNFRDYSGSSLNADIILEEV